MSLKFQKKIWHLRSGQVTPPVTVQSLKNNGGGADEQARKRAKEAADAASARAAEARRVRILKRGREAALGGEEEQGEGGS